MNYPVNWTSFCNAKIQCKKIFAKIVTLFIPVRQWRKVVRNYVVYGDCRGLNIHAYEEVVIKQKSLADCGAQIETLFIGSSHVAFGINPEVFSSFTFNLGAESQDIRTGLRLLENVVPEMPKLKTVVLGYSLFSQGSNLALVSDDEIRTIYKKVWNIDYVSDSVVYRKALLRLKYIPCSKDCIRGYIPSKSQKGRHQDAYTRVHAHLKQFKYESRNYLVAEMHGYLKSRGIRLLLFIPPVRRDYINAMPTDKDYFGEIKELCKGLGVDVANFFADQDFADDDFIDTDHLNVTGAKKLSEKLNSWLMNTL